MSSKDQIMFKEKYPNIFSNGSYCVCHPSNILRNTGILKLGNISRNFPRFSWGILTESCDASGPITYERKYLMDNNVDAHKAYVNNTLNNTGDSTLDRG